MGASFIHDFTKSPRDNPKPSRITQVRNIFSLTRCNAKAPICPPAIEAIAATKTCVQATLLEKAKITTAEAFITPASTFFVAPALRTARPEIVKAANINIPIPPPKYPP